MWFIFHVLRFSEEFQGLLQALSNISVPPKDGKKFTVNYRRCLLRNKFQEQITELRKQYGIAEGMDIQHLRSKMQSVFKAIDGIDELDKNILSEIVAFGDGNAYLERVVQPIFRFLAYENDKLGGSSREHVFRINYEDCNESLTIRKIVHHALKKLGLSKQQTREPNRAYQALNRIGEIENRPISQGYPIDQEKAETWWRQNAFVKTFYERRSWAQIYRSFYRVIAFNTCLFHLLFVIAVSGHDINSMTKICLDDVKQKDCYFSIPTFVITYLSVVLTHSFLAMCERFSANHLTRKIKDQTLLREIRAQKDKQKNLKAGKGKDKISEVEGGSMIKQPVLPHAIKKNVNFRFVDGVPFMGFLGGIQWLLIFLVLLVLFLLQYTVKKTGNSVQNIGQYATIAWTVAAVAYIIVNLLHWCLSTRDGYVVSVMGMLGLDFGYSLRSKSRSFLYRKMKLGSRQTCVSVVFWVLVLLLKSVFDYYLIVNPLAGTVKLLNDINWLQFTTKTISIPSAGLLTSIPYPNGDRILVIARILPSFLIVLIDGSIFYTIGVVVFGQLRGLIYLKLGVIANWKELQSEFGKLSQLWWFKSVSEQGRRNIMQANLNKWDPAALNHLEPATLWVHEILSKQVRKQEKLRAKQAEKEMKKNKGRKNDKNESVEQKPKPQMQLNVDATETDILTAFSGMWDATITDFRQADLIGNHEREYLIYHHFPFHGSFPRLGVSPIVSPIFYYAGQCQRAAEQHSHTPQAIKALDEIRGYMLWTFFQLRLLTMEDVTILKDLYFQSAPSSRDHRQGRKQLLQGLIEFFTSIKSVYSAEDEQILQIAAQRKVEAVTLSLNNIMTGLAAEMKVLQSTAGVFGKKNKALATQIEQIMNRVKEVISTPKEVAARLEFLLNESSKQNENYISVEHVRKMIDILATSLTVSRRVTAPRVKECKQFLSSFCSSLFNPQLVTPPPLHQTLSFTTLVPIYEEDVVYGIEQDEAAASLGLDMPSRPQELTDLLTETETTVPLLSYLQSVFPKEWSNFQERIGEGFEFQKDYVSGEAFKEEGPLHEIQHELLLWASFRGQLLARTVRGMMQYERAYRTIVRIEHPKPDNMPQQQYDAWVEDLVATKYRLVVAGQVYGRNRKSRVLKHAWDAYAMDLLLHRFPGMRLSYIDTENLASGTQQYAVLVRASSMHTTKRIQEVYRIKFPQNPFTKRGMVIGEGKPENQNHAMQFCFGECLQTIDMNQDNFILEAMKMRTLVSELQFSGIKYNKQITNAKEMIKYQDQKYTKQLQTTPMLIGFKEWIFSERAGAMGSFAAATEFTFGTVLQRVMTYPGAARFHYGHPDVWNKLFSMSKGGISKATRNLHVSEDVFGGMNCVLRGGLIWYRDYITVGKGRDMGFVSINGFEIKIAGGNGEVCISRDTYRLGTRLDFFRLMFMYHSGPGYFINNAVLMQSIFVYTWVLLLLAMANAYQLTNTISDSSNLQGQIQSRLQSLNNNGTGGPAAPSSGNGGPSTPGAASSGSGGSSSGGGSSGGGSSSGGGGGGGSSSSGGGSSSGGDTGGGQSAGGDTATAESGGGVIGRRLFSQDIPFINTIKDHIGVLNHIGSLLFYRSPQQQQPQMYDNQVSLSQQATNNSHFANFLGGSTRALLQNIPTSAVSGAPLEGPVLASYADQLDNGPLNLQPSQYNYYSDKYFTVAQQATSLVQLGMLSIIAYIAELLLEQGIFFTIQTIALQFAAGFLMFFIFKQQTAAHSFTSDMQYGGARYVGTGREFALNHNSYTTIYSRYGRSHLYYGVNLLKLCVILILLQIPGYAPATFSAWMMGFCLLVAPFWFNPMQFKLKVVSEDFKGWQRWMSGESLDQSTGTTWYSWHQAQLARMRNEQGIITDHRLNIFQATCISFLASIILVFAAISKMLMKLEWNYLQYKFLAFALFSIILFLIMFLHIKVTKKFKRSGNSSGIRFMNIFTLILWVIFCVVVSLVTNTSKCTQGQEKTYQQLIDSGLIDTKIASYNYPKNVQQYICHDGEANGLKNFVLMLYADLQIFLFIVQCINFYRSEKPGSRAFVDSSYRMLDYFIGYVIFAIIFFLAATKLLGKLQNLLLYNVSFARSIHTRKIVQIIGREKQGDDSVFYSREFVQDEPLDLPDNVQDRLRTILKGVRDKKATTISMISGSKNE